MKNFLFFKSYKETDSNENELYSLDHALLNLNVQSLWLNMGYWKHTQDYVQANKNLADLLYDQIPTHINNATLIDFGFGCGDQILHYINSRSIEIYVGVTNEKSQYTIATKLLDQNLNDNLKQSKPIVKLFNGNSTDIQSWKNQHGKYYTDLVSENRVNLNLQHFSKFLPYLEQFDIVLSLDACYHFDTRENFLKIAFDLLKPGGYIAITDLILGFDSQKNAFNSVFLNLIAKLTNIPKANLINQDEYEILFKKIGFTNLKLLDITDHVFKGLVKNCSNQTKNFKTGFKINFLKNPPLDNEIPIDWFKYEHILPKIFNYLDTKKVFRFFVVSAQKPT
ncbi:hypothetical protein HK099_000665 [Clydaea vesicula]|uniref:phosphoethanolamine N-methyltransferase n=1 Tax=Clydaea vesicula TaxID=447962 RepID=A0AAD5TXI3_9FUNG|nr:hypothetical protein HK099_000665 [Clydaea vesicula]